MNRLVRQPRSIYYRVFGVEATHVCGLNYLERLAKRSMAITRAKKETILAKLEQVRDSADSIVFVKFKGVTVKDTTAMRRAMRAAGVDYFVAKKTLMKRAFGTAYEGEMPTLDGEIAIAYSTDAIAPAQNVKEFATKFKDAISIEGGVFQGVFKNKAEMTAIASIPPLQVLRGMFAQLLNSPRQRFAVVLSKVSETK